MKKKPTTNETVYTINWTEHTPRSVKASLTGKCGADGSAAPSDPMAAARARGAAYKSSELAKPENLSIARAAQRVGNSENWINTLRQRGELYALIQDGQTRKFRYPEWQFAAEKMRLTPVLGALSKAKIGCWGIHSFVHTPLEEIEGMTPRDWILRSDKPLEPVLRAVARQFAGDQGAQ